ncbi:DNA polymerase III subunit gamma/tau [Ilyomonas limi]|uniref:DNA polymerase III subunit gamma/tau n=2 Tax=Ilyomonas limi TaxID=2575867 RepID=A0A4V5UVM1_9BACT|nr:DNA polymerase III subunit gamma/tau [Ilyomonas limi]
MEKFIVSARKYRPQTFSTVVGQQHITTTLKNAINNHQLAHAFLFCGPRGVGKTTCARILAKTINCENLQPDGEACNQCQSCRSFNEGTSLNIHELDAASNNSVDDIRALVEQVRFAPQAGKYKVYIVDEVHMLSASAFNAFLKTLEEPPPYAIFILATTEKHKILPTILSRCQIFDFKRITINDTVEHLEEIAGKERIDTEKAALQLIAQKSEGCMRDALSILDKIVSFTNGEVTYQNTLEHLNILDEDYYFKLLNSLLQQDLATAMLLYDEINRKGFEGDMVLNGFAMFLRNVLVCKDAKAAPLLDVVEGMQQRYIEAANSVSASFLVSALNILNEAEINYKMARNKRLHVEMAIIKLNFLQQALDLSIENNEIVKKKRVDAPVALKVQPIQPFQPKAAPAAKPKAVNNTNNGEQVTANGHTAKPMQPSVNGKQVNMPVQETAELQATSKLFIQQDVAPKPSTVVTAVKKAAVAYSTTTAIATHPKTKRSLLEALRDKYGDQYNIEEVKEAEPLEMQKLQECWNSFAKKLEEQQKHSAANTFKIARLEIEHETKFIITVNAITQQRFIEQERMMLADCIQQSFNNRAIQFQIVVSDDVDTNQEISPFLTMNSRERFEYIASQYPLVRELKERLKLDIDSI